MKLNVSKPILALICYVVLAITNPSAAHACPTIGGLIDYNCDQQHKMVFIGDSIVRGVGDERHDGNGGYPLRIAKAFPLSTVVNQGQPGFSTRRLLRLLTKRLKNDPNSTLRTEAKNADLVGIAIGTNDFWEHSAPELTVRNIKRIVALVRDELEKDLGVAPLMAVATLTPTKRAYQRGFINSVNALLKQQNSASLPVRLFYDSIPLGFISFDGLHPTSPGYTALSKIAVKFIQGSAQKLCSANRHDNDGDGIYDKFENSLFGTDPQILDTDGDGISDGDEVFSLHTNPLTAN